MTLHQQNNLPSTSTEAPSSRFNKVRRQIRRLGAFAGTVSLLATVACDVSGPSSGNASAEKLPSVPGVSAEPFPADVGSANNAPEATTTEQPAAPARSLHTPPAPERSASSPNLLNSQDKQELIDATGFDGLGAVDLYIVGQFEINGYSVDILGVNGNQPPQDIEQLELYATAAGEYANQKQHFTQTLWAGTNREVLASFNVVPASELSSTSNWKSSLIFAKQDKELASLASPVPLPAEFSCFTANNFYRGRSVALIGGQGEKADDGLTADNVCASVEFIQSAIGIELDPESVRKIIKQNPNYTLSNIEQLVADIGDWVANSIGYAFESARAGTPYEVYVGQAKLRKYPQHPDLFANYYVVDKSAFHI